MDFSNYWRQGQNWDTGLPFLNGQKKPVLIATDQQQGTAKTGAPQTPLSKGRSHAYCDLLGCRTGTQTAARPERDELDEILFKSWR